MAKQARTISEFDWNFDAVTEVELVACCHWEYARKSARAEILFPIQAGSA